MSAHRALLPGLLLCGAVTAIAYAGSMAQALASGRVWVEALVIAIVVGTGLRSAWTPRPCFEPGIAFSAKTLLEIAVVLLGLSVGTTALAAAGPMLIAGIAIVVVCAVAASYGIGRGFGLSHKMALLIACGNSICGNSAIAAAAPVIRASSEDVAASIAFTAVLGVIVVLALPLAALALHLSQVQYGIFAGLTVYAVPQVIAATAPLGATSVQIGTLVKLVRVVMLGPVLVALSVASRQGAAGPSSPARPRLVPLFILGFLAMIALRATGLVPPAVVAGASEVASALTVMAMAALGLCVDVRSVGRAGLRVTAVVVASLLALAVISLALVLLVGAR